MIETTLSICFVILGAAALLSLWRLISGPGVLDRVIAYDSAAICIIGLMVLLSIRWQSDLLIETIMIFSLLGFMGSIAFVCYLNTAIPRQRASSAAWREKKEVLKEQAAESRARKLAAKTKAREAAASHDR